MVPQSPEAQCCHLGTNDDKFDNGVSRGNSNAGPSMRSNDSSSTAERRRRSSCGGLVTSSLSGRLIVFLVWTALAVCCTSKTSAASLTTSTGQFEPDSPGGDTDDQSDSLMLSPSERHYRHQLVDIISSLLHDAPRTGNNRPLVRVQQHQQQYNDYGARSSAEPMDIPMDDSLESLVDADGAQWNMNSEPATGKRQRKTTKRGPGVCINSCLTGGMTFVRCKSMCHW